MICSIYIIEEILKLIIRRVKIEILYVAVWHYKTPKAKIKHCGKEPQHPHFKLGLIQRLANAITVRSCLMGTKGKPPDVENWKKLSFSVQPCSSFCYHSRQQYSPLSLSLLSIQSLLHSQGDYSPEALTGWMHFTGLLKASSRQRKYEETRVILG